MRNAAQAAASAHLRRGEQLPNATVFVGVTDTRALFEDLAANALKVQLEAGELELRAAVRRLGADAEQIELRLLIRTAAVEREVRTEFWADHPGLTLPSVGRPVLELRITALAPGLLDSARSAPGTWLDPGLLHPVLDAFVPEPSPATAWTVTEGLERFWPHERVHAVQTEAFEARLARGEPAEHRSWRTLHSVYLPLVLQIHDARGLAARLEGEVILEPPPTFAIPTDISRVASRIDAASAKWFAQVTRRLEKKLLRGAVDGVTDFDFVGDDLLTRIARAAASPRGARVG